MFLKSIEASFTLHSMENPRFDLSLVIFIVFLGIFTTVIHHCYNLSSRLKQNQQRICFFQALRRCVSLCTEKIERS